MAKQPIKKKKAVKDMSDEEYRVFLESRYNKKTGKRKNVHHTMYPDVDIDSKVKGRRNKINEGKKKTKAINDFIFGN